MFVSMHNFTRSWRCTEVWKHPTSGAMKQKSPQIFK